MVRRKGFTMVELLVVIGVLTLLAALAVFGMRSMAGQGLSNQTRVALANCQSILSEYDAKTGLRNVPRFSWKHVPAAIHDAQSDGKAMIWMDADPDAPGNQGLDAPGDVKDDSPDREGTAAVRNTQIVLYMAAGVPANKTLLGNVQPDRTTRLTTDLPANPAINETVEPILLDGWGNPIIFVPSSGMRQAFMSNDAATEYVVTSVKTYTAAQLPNGTVAPTARPFFASAGPDGRFGGSVVDPSDSSKTITFADDNLYSFER